MNTAVAESPRILVVDDTPTNLELVAGILEPEFEVLVANSGVRALEILARGARPDLMLLNVRMPVVDGYQLCAAIKLNSVTRHIPIIFVTANDDPESEIAALEAGGSDFVHRPINRHVLRSRIRIQLEVAAYRTRLEDLVHERTLDLALARDAAESANRTKSTFLANVSHELKTPLHGMLSFMSLASRRTQDEKAAMWLEKAMSSGNRLLRLVDDLLDMSRLESEELRLEIGDFDLDAMLIELGASARAKSVSKGLQLQLDRDPNMPVSLRGDRKRVLQVLQQLVENAVKFASHGTVGINVRLMSQETGGVLVRFIVSDQGHGIPPSFEKDMFGLFTQGDESASRGHVGTGLGLALCRRLTTLMGGNVTYRRAEDRNEFLVTLGFQLGEGLRTRVAGLEPPDLDNHAIEVVRRLGSMLAQGDLAAVSFWIENEAFVAPYLTTVEADFAAAMEACDFPRALTYLDRGLQRAPVADTGP